MKKLNVILLASALLATIAFNSSCKKTGDPGPAGANGTNGADGADASALLYKQAGTTLNLTGIYSSDGSSFDNTYALSYYATLDENSIVEEDVLVDDGEDPEARTSAEVNTVNYFYHIVRRDSLNHSVLSFDISFYDGDTEPTVENLTIDIITDVNAAGYKRISTGYVYNPSVSGPTANGFFQRGYLEHYDIVNYSTLAFSNWNYNATTRKLSFDFSGTLEDNHNSTKNPLLIDAHVSADLNQETHRIGKE